MAEPPTTPQLKRRGSFSFSELSAPVTDIIDNATSGFQDAVSLLDEMLENNDWSSVGKIKQDLEESRRKMKTYWKNMNKDTNRALKDLQIGTAKRVKRAFRKAIVGDADQSLREHLTKTSTLGQIDQFSFTFSLVNCALIEYLLLKHPVLYSIYYLCILSGLMIARYYFYKSLHYQYFMLDLCYWINLLCCIDIALYWLDLQMPTFSTTLFVMVSGPVLWGIVVWRNSMVFHSIDKMTSMFIHVCPALYVYCKRWLIEEQNIFHELDLKHWLLYPIFTWWSWQFAYQFKVEYLDSVSAKPHIVTSGKWMTGDKKSVLTNLSLKTAKKLGYFASDETFDYRNVKTKIVFTAVNFLYFLVVILPAPLMFYSYYFHTITIIVVLIMSLINGASYYIDVFSSRYYQKLEKRATELEKALKIATPKILEEKRPKKD